MAKIEAVKDDPQDTSASRPTSPDAQTTLDQSAEVPKPSRPNSLNGPGSDAPRIPSLDSDSPKVGTPAPAPEIPIPEAVMSKQPDAKEELQLAPLVPLNDLSRSKSESSFQEQAAQDSYKPPHGAKRRACGAGWNRFMRGSYVGWVWTGRVLLILGVGVGVVVMAA